MASIYSFGERFGFTLDLPNVKPSRTIVQLIVVSSKLQTLLESVVSITLPGYTTATFVLCVLHQNRPRLLERHDYLNDGHTHSPQSVQRVRLLDRGCGLS